MCATQALGMPEVMRMTIEPGKTYFYRTIQYETTNALETRQFVILSTRYAIRARALAAPPLSSDAKAKGWPAHSWRFLK
jgi:hypothetical protein